MPECMAIGSFELFGTNALSFQDVLDLYTKSLINEGWHLRFSESEGSGFDRDDFALAISVPVKEFQCDPDIIAEGKRRFRTLFVIEMSTLVVRPVPKNCRDE